MLSITYSIFPIVAETQLTKNPLKWYRSFCPVGCLQANWTMTCLSELHAFHSKLIRSQQYHIFLLAWLGYLYYIYVYIRPKRTAYYNMVPHWIYMRFSGVSCASPALCRTKFHSQGDSQRISWHRLTSLIVPTCVPSLARAFSVYPKVEIYFQSRSRELPKKSLKKGLGKNK